MLGSIENRHVHVAKTSAKKNKNDRHLRGRFQLSTANFLQTVSATIGKTYSATADAAVSPGDSMPTR
jgi:hypothetical protein